MKTTPVENVAEIYARGAAAFANWSRQPLSVRASYLRRLRLQIVEQIDTICETVAEDTGKVPLEALTADVMPVLEQLKYIEKHGIQLLGRQKRKTPFVFLGKKSYVEYMPRGCVLVISPWNYPFQLAMVPVVSALAAGNTVVLKPSEVTPKVAATIHSLFAAAELPDDVVQVHLGDGELGAELVRQRPDYIFFTGSVRTGRLVQQQAAKDLIPTTLELGGKDAMIVFSDAHLSRAVRGALWGGFTNSGQVCISVERLFVQESVLEPFLSELADHVHTLRPGRDQDADLGSMTYQAQFDIAREQLQDALEKGAKVVCGGLDSANQGLFFPPTVLRDVTADMRVLQEETFGPILPVVSFSDEGQAIRLANDSPYGLYSSVWSRDIRRAERVASQLVAGGSVINDVITGVANPHLPFGGTKFSGLGRYHGPEGLRSFCHQKAITVDSGRRSAEMQWYPYRGKYAAVKALLKTVYGQRKQPLALLKAGLRLLR